MRALVLVALAIVASFIIVVALVRQKPCEQPQPIAVISTESPLPKAPLIEPKAEIPPATIKMPEPILITSWKDANRIPDANLRAFVRRKADFRTDNVLFFEWKGGKGDKMTGDLTTKDKKYTITLHPAQVSQVGQEVLHRQIFVIPANYHYVCEIAK